MKRLSNWSIVLAVIGILSFCCSFVFPKAFEPLMAIGFGALLIGMLISFGAMLKSEKGKSKSWLWLHSFFWVSFWFGMNHFKLSGS